MIKQLVGIQQSWHQDPTLRLQNRSLTDQQGRREDSFRKSVVADGVPDSLVDSCDAVEHVFCVVLICESNPKHVDAVNKPVHNTVAEIQRQDKGNRAKERKE